MRSPASPHVYRLRDAVGRLLYVGCSIQATRIQQHAGKAWWRQVAIIEVEHYQDHVEALEAEATAIRDEHPLFNVQGISEAAPPDVVRARCEAKAAEDEARRLAGLGRTHYRVSCLVCTNELCGWRGQWVPKGKTLDEVPCPTCGCSSLINGAERVTA